jgi:hypothetical protein
MLGFIGIATTIHLAVTGRTAQPSSSPDTPAKPHHNHNHHPSFTASFGGITGKDPYAFIPILGFATVAAIGAAALDPTGLGFAMALPVGILSSVLGYAWGAVRPGKSWVVSLGLHPMITAAIAVNLAVSLHGKAMGWSYTQAMGAFFNGQVSIVTFLTIHGTIYIYQDKFSKCLGLGSSFRYDE